MQKIIVASTRKSAGKTSVTAGLAQAFGKPFGYMKPFGDRLVYREKHLWDYDSATISGIFGLKDNPEDTTIGFQHSKLKYMYDEAGTRAKIREIAENSGKGKDLLIVESGQDLAYGASIHLDAVSLANYLEGKLLLVVSGGDDMIVDDIYFLKKHIDTKNIDWAGIVINKVHDVEDFKDSYLASINDLDVKVLGIMPFRKDLTHFSVGYLSDGLVAKVISGEKGLKNMVKHIFVGAMSADDAIRSLMFKKEHKVIITSGDRSDMIVAALETDSAGIVLTNNIYPPSNIISMAEHKNIPLLLVGGDTYQVASRIDEMEPLLARDDSEKVELLGKLVKAHVNLEQLI